MAELGALDESTHRIAFRRRPTPRSYPPLEADGPSREKRLRRRCARERACTARPRPRGESRRPPGPTRAPFPARPRSPSRRMRSSPGHPRSRPRSGLARSQATATSSASTPCIAGGWMNATSSPNSPARGSTSASSTPCSARRFSWPADRSPRTHGAFPDLRSAMNFPTAVAPIARRNSTRLPPTANGHRFDTLGRHVSRCSARRRNISVGSNRLLQVLTARPDEFPSLPPEVINRGLESGLSDFGVALIARPSPLLAHAGLVFVSASRLISSRY